MGTEATLPEALDFLGEHDSPPHVVGFLEQTVRYAHSLGSDVVLRISPLNGLQGLRGEVSFAWWFPIGRLIQFRTEPSSSDAGVEKTKRGARMNVRLDSRRDVAESLLRRAFEEAGAR